MEINMEKCLKKWGPILDALKVEDEPRRRYIAEYAERHQLKDSEYYLTNEYHMNGNIAQNLLPVAVKVLAGINLEGKTVEFVDHITKSIEIMHDMSEEETKGVKEQNGMDIIQKLEGLLLNKLIKKINEDLIYANTLIIDLLVTSISLISEKSFKPRMIVRSKYKVK